MMKKVVLAIAALSLVAIAAFATPITGDILGAWVNIDPEADGLAQITILPSESGGLNVFGYGVCSPSFCEWGATPLVLVGMAPDFVEEWGVAVWDDAPFMTIMTLRLEGTILVAEMFSYMTDGTGIPRRELVLLRQVL
jgi:hypothetical protein